MTKWKSTPRRRLASKKIRRLVADLCHALTRHHDPDAADRAQTAMTEAETRRNGGR